MFQRNARHRHCELMRYRNIRYYRFFPSVYGIFGLSKYIRHRFGFSVYRPMISFYSLIIVTFDEQCECKLLV